jgi:hypothetical protein
MSVTPETRADDLEKKHSVSFFFLKEINFPRD